MEEYTESVEHASPLESEEHFAKKGVDRLCVLSETGKEDGVAERTVTPLVCANARPAPKPNTHMTAEVAGKRIRAFSGYRRGELFCAAKDIDGRRFGRQHPEV